MSDPGNAARLAALSWGLPEPQHLRTGMSSLWSVNDEMVLRVTTDDATSKRWPLLSTELLRQGIRVPRSLGEMSYAHDGWIVTRVEHIHSEGAVDWAEVGAMVRLVHALDPAPLLRDMDLPWCGSFVHWQVDRLFADAWTAASRPAATGAACSPPLGTGPLMAAPFVPALPGPACGGSPSLLPRFVMCRGFLPSIPCVPARCSRY